jgi:asparagine synthase (glutamine-hydrolysing)
MCGIAGFVRHRDGALPRPEAVADALEALAHRGPDDAGATALRNVVLLHRRLSIVDLAGGAQPMTNDDATVVVVFNGEIWNHLDVRAQLERLGHRFRTRSDTEVLVHGYEQWGSELVERLDGMFAFAVWDESRRALLLARDRVGKKPIYLARTSSGFVFGSDARAVLLLGDIRPVLDEDRVAEYLFQRYVASPRTLWRGVEKLEPATVVEIRNGEMRRRRYWAPPTIPTDRVDAGDLRALLRRAAEKRLMADVPIGVLLSGGVDSAAVLGLMVEAGATDVASFTIGFDQSVYDERMLARATATRYRTDHHEIVVSTGDFVSALGRLSWYRDEPIAEPSEVPLLLLAELAGRHVKVVVAGDGGDELFGGYPKYRAERLLRGGAAAVPLALRTALAAATAARTPRRLDRALGTLAIRDRELRWASWFRTFDSWQLATLLAPGLRRTATQDGLVSTLRQRLEPYTALDDTARMLMGDFLTYLPENMLARGDKVLMAASVEGRMPLVDVDVVEHVAASRGGDRVSARRGKLLLRRAVADLVPPEVAAAPKRGFPVPVASLLLDPAHSLAERLLLSDRCLERGLFDADALRSFVSDTDARSGKDLHLFTLVSLELWCRNAIDSCATQAPRDIARLVGDLRPKTGIPREPLVTI